MTFCNATRACSLPNDFLEKSRARTDLLFSIFIATKELACSSCTRPIVIESNNSQLYLNDINRAVNRLIRAVLITYR